VGLKAPDTGLKTARLHRIYPVDLAVFFSLPSINSFVDLFLVACVNGLKSKKMEGVAWQLSLALQEMTF